MARLTELFNAHGGRQAMTSYSKRGTDADELRQAEFVYAPTVAVYAVSTPQTLFDAVTSAHIADGFLNRFLVFSSRQGAQPMRWRARSLQCPVEISAWMQHVRNRWCIRRNDFSESDDASRPCQAIHIEESPEALCAFQALDRRKTELIRANEGAQRFFVRTVEKARRIAAIVALGENYETQTVDAECSEWACAVAWTCDLELMRVAQDRIADSEQEALVKRVIRLIRRRSVIPHSELVRATWWIKNGQREDILLTLLQSEAIEIREIVTASGRTVREYVAT